MEGPANNKGLVPRIFQRAFELFSGDGDIKSFEISLQFFELYKSLESTPQKPKWVNIRSWGDRKAALKELQDSINLFEKKPIDVYVNLPPWQALHVVLAFLPSHFYE